MKKVFAILLAVILLVGLAGCTQTPPETQPETGDAMINIGILQLTEHAALDAARDGFIQALADNGFVDGENITIDLQNAQDDQSNLSSMSDRFVSNNVDLILAIATPAAQAVAGKTTEIPILITAVTDPVDARLVDSMEMPGGNVTGTTDMNPIAGQIELITRLAPDAKTIGIFYNSSEPNSVLQAEIARSNIEALGLTVVEQTVTGTNDVQQAAQSLMGKVDAVYLPTDNTIAAAMPVLSAVAVEAGIPVICGESNMVEAGGFATLGLNYYNLGYQTGEMAVRILRDGADPASMPIESQTNFDYMINGEVAEALGIEIPADLQEFVI